MIELAVYNGQGKEVEKLSLPEERLGGEVKKALLKEAVLMYEANKRVGTACTKTKAEVHGSGRKPWAQKHTGRARAGTVRSPLWRKGGVVFGPKPRDYSYQIPKKAKKAALHSALLGKLLDGEVTVVDMLEFDAPRTKKMVQLLKTLGIHESCLMVAKDNNHVLWKSVRNIPGMALMPASQLNAYEVLKRKRLLITKDQLNSIQ
ncbi:MAG TPA: 50S ribosomal protein L4 [Candidatus Brocadiales bacterium]|nr:50S ribosomal protein L4 [Candidatus Brocadiales bacterium]